jgi:hypothetical protein
MIINTAIAKKTCTVAVCAALLAWSGMSLAAESQSGEYRPNEFLGLDLPTAVLSPKPLGPPAQFAPVAIEAYSGSTAPQARAESDPVPDQVAADKTVARPTVRTVRAAARVAKPRGEARVKLARRHGNPLDAQASDTRVQVWPCKSGGICNWQRQ